MTSDLVVKRHRLHVDISYKFNKELLKKFTFKQRNDQFDSDHNLRVAKILTASHSSKKVLVSSIGAQLSQTMNSLVLSKSISSLQHGDFNACMRYGTGYLSSWLAYSFLSHYGQYFMLSWQNDLKTELMSFTILKLTGKSTLMKNNHISGLIHHHLTNRHSQIANHTVGIAGQWMNLFWGFVGNNFALLRLNCKFVFFGTMTSLVIAISSAIMTKKRIDSFSFEIEKLDSECMSLKNKIWEISLSGNRQELCDWQIDFNRKNDDFNTVKQDAEYYASAVSILTSCLMLASLTGGWLLSFYSFVQRREDHLISGDYISSLANLISSWSMLMQISSVLRNSFSVISQFSSAIKNISNIKSSDLSGYIAWEEMNFYNTRKLSSFSHLMRELENKHYVGLWRIVGRNGSGKSSLLKMLNEIYQEESIYLDCGRSYYGVSHAKSSGESLMASLHKICNTDSKMIFLDEPFANLDCAATTEAIHLLRTLSQRRFLVYTEVE